MYNHMTSFDLSILLTRGFEYGISQEILWGKSNDGREFQVLDNGRWLMFGERRQNGGVNQHRRMLRHEFEAIFPR